jgi:hypothetical protein
MSEARSLSSLPFVACEAHSLSSLPFVACEEDGSIKSLWAVVPTGVWEDDVKTGQGYADAIIDRMRASGSYGVIYQVAKAMPRKNFGGIECGFYVRLGSAAIGH